MNVPSFLATTRLLIEPLNLNDNNFILDLVNTEGWLKFIGNRNIKSSDESINYIQKILANKNIVYWIVKLKNNKDKIGVVTFIKRDYLEHHDIGFAFLPKFSKNGYAYEAVNAVLNQLFQHHDLKHILATTIPENTNSIKLLERLGLIFEKEIEIEKEKLYVFGASAEN